MTVTLTEQQRQTVLSGLAGELLDAKRYLSGPAPSKTPGPMDDCCDGHRDRWQRDVDLHEALTAKRDHIERTIEAFLYEGEAF